MGFSVPWFSEHALQGATALLNFPVGDREMCRRDVRAGRFAVLRRCVEADEGGAAPTSPRTCSP